MNHRGMQYSLAEPRADRRLGRVDGRGARVRRARAGARAATRSSRACSWPRCGSNMPAVVVTGGPMLAGRADDGSAIDLNTVFEAVGQHMAGKIDDEELKAMECAACPTCGSCSGLFTANSMGCLTEGSVSACRATAPSRRRTRSGIRLAKLAGEKVMRVLRRRTCGRATSSPTPRSATPSPSTRASAARPTPCCTWRPSPRGGTRLPPRAHQRDRRDDAAPVRTWRRPASITWRISTAPAASRRSCRELVEAGLMDGSARTVTGLDPR